jgi:hypothetical protein
MPRGKQCRAAPNCAMAVALARLFYMMQGINPMTDGAKPRTLKDQLESETADTERSAAVDSERYHGGDWWQLTDAEESVFVIDRKRFPRMITVCVRYSRGNLVRMHPGTSAICHSVSSLSRCA